ncbi:MAG: hypothetical protein ACREOO_08655 [bacterium]
MFVGHYGVSFFAKRMDTSIPLWILFIAVQLVDVFWAIFVLLGIEKVRIVPGITATNPLDLYYMPYTHSLLASCVWLGLGALGYRFLGTHPRTWRAGIIVGVAVFSHWILDFLVHRPDLPLYDDAFKTGLGLWNYPAFAFLLETGLMFGGMFLYLRASEPKTPLGKYGMPIFGILMLLLQSSVFFGPPPGSPAAVAITALFSYFAFAGAIHWLEKRRR